MNGLAYIDGQTCDLRDARVPLLDRGYLLGDGVFETLRTANGSVFQLEAHRTRFLQGLKALGLDPEVEDLFQDAVAQLVTGGVPKFGDELYLRINATTGVTEDLDGRDAGVTITGICKPFKPYPMRYFSHGIHLILSKRTLEAPNPTGGAKTMSFQPYVMARREAHAQTAHDAVLCNQNGRVSEATTSNVFAVKDGTVFAPGVQEGAVDGVTRQLVLGFLQDAGIPVEESLTLDTLRAADELFVTNTTGGVVPVTRFEDTPVGKGEKGELTARLGHAYEDLVRGR